jgi:putative protease
MKRIAVDVELLAPVGYKDALKAAIIGGADAVYLGGKDFGARRLAENFDDGEMRSAIKLAHDHHVKVYVTVNTLIKETELETAAGYIDMLRSINADAVIVADRGLLRLIKDSIKMPVHASTQMGIDSLEGVLWAQEEGIERVILARELSLAQIRKIKEGSKVGLEVFVHGALCYCYSGQCLFSSMLGGRSGNRGLCAQPCRKEYEIGDEHAYMLSTADTFGIEAIPELLRLGVKSLKIEGRMRNPLYVYVATKVYKNAIKRAQAGDRELITPRERELLETVFNRGFSRGYLMDTNVMSREYCRWARASRMAPGWRSRRTSSCPGTASRCTRAERSWLVSRSRSRAAPGTGRCTCAHLSRWRWASSWSTRPRTGSSTPCAR